MTVLSYEKWDYELKKSGLNSNIHLQYHFAFLFLDKKKFNTGHKIKTFGKHDTEYQEMLALL